MINSVNKIQMKQDEVEKYLVGKTAPATPAASHHTPHIKVLNHLKNKVQSTKFRSKQKGVQEKH